MIAYVIGIVAEVSEDSIIVENNGMGFRIRVPYGYAFKQGEQLKIHTYTYVKEDAFLLYGFDTKDQLELFQKLITVNGVGPKGALSILSILSTNDLRFAIYSQDIAAIAKAPGIGKKTAERVILDLKDKVSLSDITAIPGESEGAPIFTGDMDVIKKEAVDALTALGYGISDAAKAVSQVPISEDTTTEDILKQALRYMV